MTKRGAPNKSQSTTMRKLYKRLLEGPFWLGDHKSAGIGSRNTANDAIKIAFTDGLVTKRRDGHRILYELIPHDIFPSRISDWWPYLTTAVERAQLVGDRDTSLKTWVQEVLHRIKPLAQLVGVYGRLSQDEETVVEIDLSHEEIMRLIVEADSGVNYMDAVGKWELIQRLQLCPKCLMDEKEFVPTVFDHELGEVSCSKSGLVISRDPIQRTRDPRPSPFNPPN